MPTRAVNLDFIEFKGASATCRVLLDGEKEISAKTGAAGERVECRIQTPVFG